MKPFKNPEFAIALLMAVFSMSLSNCVFSHRTGSANRLYPGQAKKTKGKKSANNFAPGHNK